MPKNAQVDEARQVEIKYHWIVWSFIDNFGILSE